MLATMVPWPLVLLERKATDKAESVTLTEISYDMDGPAPDGIGDFVAASMSSIGRALGGRLAPARALRGGAALEPAVCTSFATRLRMRRSPGSRSGLRGLPSVFRYRHGTVLAGRFRTVNEFTALPPSTHCHTSPPSTSRRPEESMPRPPLRLVALILFGKRAAHEPAFLAATRSFGRGSPELRRVADRQADVAEDFRVISALARRPGVGESRGEGELDVPSMKAPTPRLGGRPDLLLGLEPYPSPAAEAAQ